MRAGVFLCECGGNISGVLDLVDLEREARSLDDVVTVAVEQFLCGTAGRRQIAEAVEDRGLDHIVIAACSPRFQGPTFERITRDLKLGENAVAFANLREGCSFVHRDDPRGAQKKARLILRAAASRAAMQHDLPRRRTFLHRSALIVGGGIAGMTCAEELSGAGIEVHLVEKEASLGGYMARLSKTFPTEDCAMCSLAPRLTSTALDPGINIHTLTDVTAISGPPGEFRVRLERRPRFVSDACVGCGECTAVCPVRFSDPFDFGIAERTAIARPFANAVPATFAVDRNGWSPCKAACPVHTSAQGYVALIAQGRLEEAFRVASERNPFPSVCGRICTRTCEAGCARGRSDDAVAIASLKRFVADTVGPTVMVRPAATTQPERVAIVGAGPAGLTCASALADLGYAVTVFEALQVAGGMLRTAIPDYRLPKDILQGEIDRILALGVELRLNQRAGVNFTIDGLLEEGYGAAFLATGLQRTADIALPGVELRGVQPAVELLRAVNLGQSAAVGDTVVVIGGGDVALDAARSAIRLQRARGRQPDVTLAYRRTQVEMPANASELREAREEGLKVEFLALPLLIVGRDGAVASLRLQRCKLGETDESGRQEPVPIEGEVFELCADTVIPAIGQELVDDFLHGCSGVRVQDNRIICDRATSMTERPGVFAGGDVAPSGFLTAIEAVAAGRRAAAAIHNYLRGEVLLPVWETEQPVARPDEARLDQLASQERAALAVLDPDERSRTWAEVSRGYDREHAMAEASRCLNCAVCSDCGSCTIACPSHAVDFGQRPSEEEVTVGAVVIASGHQEFDARRKLPLGFGRFANVITQSQLARLLSAAGPTSGELVRPSDGLAPRNVFMLQCVGSRDCTSSGNEHCSAVCCLFATLHASLIKQHDPTIQVTVGYTDLRAAGKGHEEYYRLVQSRGVRYVRGRIGEVTEEQDHRLRVRFEDTVTGRKTDELFDLVVLSAGLEASAGTLEIARVAGLQTGSAGFIKEYHPKLRPVDTQRVGMFVCGTAQGPKSIPDSIAQAKAAAARVVTMLNTGFALTPAQVAMVDTDVCIGCGVCETACPQLAVKVDVGRDGHAVVDPTACRGCGICAAECPSGAMQLGGFSDDEILAEVSV